VYSVLPTNETALPVSLVQQSPREVSLFVGPPAEPDLLTVDIYDQDRAVVLCGVAEYLEAVVAGRVELLVKERKGVAKFWLRDTDAPRVHSYNLWLASRPGRGPGWSRHRFQAY
jgi:hypothetical protein